MKLHELQIGKSWTLFLDRDGVINTRIVDDYVKTWDEFKFADGALDAIKIFSQVFGRIVVVTNQQGIGKGIMTMEQLNAIHKKMMETINKADGRIDKIYTCPFKKETLSVFRKPAVGMGLQAKKDFPEIHFKKSMMIGDSDTDMIFGKRLKMKTVFICENLYEIRTHYRYIDFTAKSLFEAANNLIKQTL